MSKTNPKVALVTGASRGIGLAIFKTLLAEGHTVIGTATGEKGCDTIQKHLSAAQGQGAAMILDLSDHAAIQAFIDQVQKQFGAPAILVNNAGITRDGLLLRMKREDWDVVLQTNLTGTFLLTQGLLRGMIKQRWGRIVSVGSVVGTMGNPGQTNYCASKAGLVGFSKALALEVAAHHITVNVVAPGFIGTDMTLEGLNEAQQTQILSRIPMKRMGQPEDIADAVDFLVSEKAKFITGETLHVNGGMVMS